MQQIHFLRDGGGVRGGTAAAAAAGSRGFSGGRRDAALIT